MTTYARLQEKQEQKEYEESVCKVKFSSFLPPLYLFLISLSFLPLEPYIIPLLFPSPLSVPALCLSSCHWREEGAKD